MRRTSTKYHHFRVVCVQIADVIGGHIYRVETVETSQQSQFCPTPMKSQSPSRRIPRLNHSLSFPRVTTRKPQLPRQTTSELLLPNGAIHVDKIAAQTQYYLTVLEEHLDAIRDHPQRPDACERLLKKRGAPHPQQLTSYTERHKLRVKMEDLIRHDATTIDE